MRTCWVMSASRMIFFLYGGVGRSEELHRRNLIGQDDVGAMRRNMFDDDAAAANRIVSIYDGDSVESEGLRPGAGLPVQPSTRYISALHVGEKSPPAAPKRHERPATEGETAPVRSDATTSCTDDECPTAKTIRSRQAGSTPNLPHGKAII